MRLLVISHTPHYQYMGTISAWGSTVRELDQLASLFDELVHLAPSHSGTPPGSSLAYSNSKISFIPVKPAGGGRFKDKLSIIGQIPAWLAAMKKEIKEADAIHIRCPAGISLVALFAQWMWARGKPTWVKYAGNWKPEKLESLTYRIQRLWLRQNFHQGVVTVNGSWSDQPEHIITFNNPSFSRAEWVQAKGEVEDKNLSFPLNLLFVGRVDEGKGIGKVLTIASRLSNEGVSFHLNVIGDGPEKLQYEVLARQQDLAEQVTFLGWKNRMELNDFYRDAHFILLPTLSEGWPKVLSEAMSYGVVPLSTAVSSIPQILTRAQTGRAIPAGDIEAYVKAIIGYTEDPSTWQRESKNSVVAAEAFTYENYLKAVSKLFNTRWKLALGIS